MEGTILTLSRNYGFIQGDDKAVYFAHFDDIKEGIHLIAAGRRVSFDTEPPLPTKHYPRAVNVIVGTISNDGRAR